MSDVMHEVNDELRQQRLEAFWIENRNWIIGGIILAIMTTAGLTWWRGYEYKQNMARTTQLIAAVKADDAKVLTDFATASGKNHAALAKFSAAGLHVKSGNIARAAELYAEIAGSMSVDRELRDLAKILSLNIRLGTEDPKKLHKELSSMSGNNEPYRYTALEMDALVYAAEGNMKDAAAKLEAISSSADAPEDSRLRATTLHEFYAASANESVPFKKDIAADKKPADKKPDEKKVDDKAAKP
ncbi:MAG: tetratricopeptide repeat protein [bacterium]|nr:tetratricopeptide repeat protein [bacterium]